MCIAFVFFLGFFWLSAIQGAELTLYGNWTETITRDDLVAGAGSDLRSPFASSVAQAALDVTQTGGNSWTLKVRIGGTQWPADVSVAVRRTSSGTGAGAISGGTGYLPVTGADQILFTGSGDRSNIQLQLKAEGFSVARHSPDVYTTTLVYTLE